jgi:putative ABC transport system permease protein
MEVGIGIIAILAVIGIMNYINSFVSSIQNRQIELSIMESVGMTGKQMKKMLMLEGILYAAGAWGITLTAGLAVTYYLYQSMNYMGVAFAIPIAPILMAAVCVFGICIGVPLMIYRNFERKASVVERMKGFE